MAVSIPKLLRVGVLRAKVLVNDWVSLHHSLGCEVLEDFSPASPEPFVILGVLTQELSKPWLDRRHAHVQLALREEDPH